MAVGMFMKWDGVTKELYDEVRGAVNWETDRPQGALFHVATFDDDGARITDIWESADDFQSFVDNRLMSAVRAAGIEGDPDVEFIPVHAIFNPGIERV
jgi:hypothetical protein